MIKMILLIPQNIFSELVKRFSEGGTFFMSLILICFISALFFLIFSFINFKKNPIRAKKMVELASEVSILGLVIGLLGSIIGMIQAFDTIEALGDMNLVQMGAGLKVSFLTALFGSITFIVPRIGIIVLKGLQKI
ncbi:MotA/TolQ/ExbB proton channel family protein [Aquimarina sp. ERC-38]|uniref:MotA/TolQ/ExbB proton channel family protein n=1 Tax=Aquimarina sp. ERC-38 TaxID=2949996 RepID=UPI002246206F|nr:MotA/TolQ/ExbB proton channel family protein [Aquimarina sp. ERC-38]UZO80642.1 MotA/TolQ/ExbB proton channel family protein [Aquimarina sp. ERC-38]